MALSGSKVVLRSMLGRRFQTVTTTLTVAIAVGLLLTILSMRDATRQTLERGSGNMHLVVSAEPSAMVSVLNAVFHAGTPSRALPWLQVLQLRRDPRVAYALPMQQGDSFEGYPVAAVEPEFFESFSPDSSFDPASGNAKGRWLVSRGRNIEGRFEVVLGALVARESGLRIGDTLQLTCGLGGGGFVHEGFPYTIVGVLELSGTPHDRVIFADLVSGWIVHAQDKRDREGGGAGARVTEGDLTSADRLVTSVYVRGVVRDGRQVSSAIAELASELRRTPSLTVASPSAEIDALFRIVNRVDRILIAMAFVVLVSGAVSIMLALYSAGQMRRREVATFRVLGASRGQLVRWVLAEAMALGVMGSVVGVVFSLAGGLLVSAGLKAQLGLVVTPSVSPWGIGVVGVSAVLLAALAGVAPAVLAYRTAVAEHLRPLG
ncbi:MAG: ABC transporter permease [Phycisphaeraceae bacterium]|nr:ABC transporter permease [Phycisphaeraceae bacterium]